MEDSFGDLLNVAPGKTRKMLQLKKIHTFIFLLAQEKLLHNFPSLDQEGLA